MFSENTYWMFLFKAFPFSWSWGNSTVNMRKIKAFKEHLRRFNCIETMNQGTFVLCCYKKLSSQAKYVNSISSSRLNTYKVNVRGCIMLPLRIHPWLRGVHQPDTGPLMYSSEASGEVAMRRCSCFFA